MKRAVAIIAIAFAAAQSLCGQVRFAFMTDLHYAEGSRSADDLRACVEDINADGAFDFTIVGGDLTDFGTDEEIASVKSILDRLESPYYVVAGNHDSKWSESGCNMFRKVFGYEHFEFEAGGWRFLGCNCGPDMRMAPALLPRESMSWLESLPRRRRSIFINHYPQDTSVLNYSDVTKALKRAGVEFGIGGHWHSNRVLDYEGIPSVICRSTLSGRDSGPGYTVVTIEGDSISFSERLAGADCAAVPWHESGLGPVRDTTSYDAHGLPASYPWMRYDVNDRYPCVREIWNIQEEANIASGFARAGGRAFYATASGMLRAIRVKDGKRVWTRAFPGKIFSTPATDGRRLVFGCTDGYIYCVKVSDGSELWKVRCGKSVVASPVLMDGLAYIGASDGHFRAVDLKSGRVVWDYPGVAGFVECRPFADRSQVVFGDWAGYLYSLDPHDGSLQWKWKTPRPSRMYSPAATVPLKSAGRIFIAVPDRKVHVLDASTGEELFSLQGGRESSGLSEDGSVVYVKTMFHHTYAFRADTPAHAPSLLWNAENGMGYEISPTPLVEVGGTLLCPSDKGNIIALDAVSGRTLWAHKLSVALVNPLEAWKDGNGIRILASCMDGSVALLSVTGNHVQK